MFLEMFMNESVASMGYSELDEIESAPLDESLDVDAQFLQFELENEQNWNAYVMGLVQAENLALREGVEVETVLEAVDFEKMRDKFEKWLDTAWSKCKAAFEKAVKKLDDLITQNKKVVKAASALKPEVKKVKIAKLKLYGTNGLDAASAKQLFDDLFDIEKLGEIKDIIEFNDYGDEAECDKILEKNNFEGGKARESAKETYKKPEESVDITVEGALAYVSGGRASAAIKAAAAASKKHFEDLKKEFAKKKRAMKRSGGFADNFGTSKAVKVLSKQQKVAKQIVSEINKTSRLLCSYANHDYNACMFVLRRAVGTKSGGAGSVALTKRAEMMGKKSGLDAAVAAAKELSKDDEKDAAEIKAILNGEKDQTTESAYFLDRIEFI